MQGWVCFGFTDFSLLRRVTCMSTGISFKTQALYALVFMTRYIDLLFRWVSVYNLVMKLFFISSSCYILYLMKYRFRCVPTTTVFCMNIDLGFDSPTHDPSIDTFKIEYLLGPSFFLALIFNYAFEPTEILWTFSIYLESVAIFPQLFMLQRTGEAETITTHYLAALGLYRALYLPNWIYRYARVQYIQFMTGRFCPADTLRRTWWIP
jgi:ER lumen protein retaining receptor